MFSFSFVLARYPNGDPLVPNSGYATSGGSTRCPASATSYYQKPNVLIKNGDTLIASGFVPGHSTSDPTVVSVTDTNMPHDLGAFQNFNAYNTDGSNARYDGTYNKVRGARG